MAPFAKACKPGLCEQTSHRRHQTVIIRKSNNTVNRNSCGHRPFINAGKCSITGWRSRRTAQPTLTGTYPRLHDINFGLASLGIGILLVVKCANLPAMVLATLLGALIGEICLLEKASIQRSPKHKICFTTHVRSQRMNLLFRIMSRLLSCFAPAAPDLRGDERRDDRRSEYFNRQVIS